MCTEKSITAITLNPCIDRTLTVDHLSAGEHHVARQVQETVAGKGIDVNVVLRHLDIPTLSVGFEFTQKGTPVADFLNTEGIPFEMHPIDAVLRVNTKIFDAEQRQMTEINCKGPKLGAEAEEAFLRLLDDALPSTAILVLSGSVPPGLSDDLYARCIKKAQEKNIPTVLDATGALLLNGIQAQPTVIKPNRHELEELLNVQLDSTEKCIRACHALIDQGIRAVCLTLGGDGALMVGKDEVWFSEGLPIQVKGVQGAGDSVVAGICAAMRKGLPMQEWLRYGVAAAHASLIREGTLLCKKEDLETFLPQIPIRKL